MTYAQSTLNVHVTGRRLVATIIDGILLSIVYSVFVALFGDDSADRGTPGRHGRRNTRRPFVTGGGRRSPRCPPRYGSRHAGVLRNERNVG
jgi:hypothetical protein